MRTTNGKHLLADLLTMIILLPIHSFKHCILVKRPNCSLHYKNEKTRTRFTQLTQHLQIPKNFSRKVLCPRVFQQLTSVLIKNFKSLNCLHNCQRVRPSEDRRPGEAAAYRAARRFLGGRNLRSASNLIVM